MTKYQVTIEVRSVEYWGAARVGSCGPVSRIITLHETDTEEQAIAFAEELSRLPELVNNLLMHATPLEIGTGWIGIPPEEWEAALNQAQIRIHPTG